jgi:hypothetical protein
MLIVELIFLLSSIVGGWTSCNALVVCWLLMLIVFHPVCVHPCVSFSYVQSHQTRTRSLGTLS